MRQTIVNVITLAALTLIDSGALAQTDDPATAAGP